MKPEPKRCTARGKQVRDTRTGAPTQDKLADGQLADHYVLCPEDRARGFIEPYRDSYIHEKCGGVTTMPAACAETYAAQPEYYGSTFCCHCRDYFRVGADGEFVWSKNPDQKVGTRRANA
jgi:hypothetical protein